MSEIKVLQTLEMQFPLVMMKTKPSYLGQNLPVGAEKGHQQLFTPPMMLLIMVKVKLLQEEGVGAEGEGGAPVH